MDIFIPTVNMPADAAARIRNMNITINSTPK